ncbi:DUF3182 family protein [Noviherbaspirillum saxi]|nr:DUF3182 family protein [Noviherbaspirillum saxi]
MEKMLAAVEGTNVVHTENAHCANAATVVILPEKLVGTCAAHELAAHTEIARRLAVLKGCEFAGEFEANYQYENGLYFVPSDTLVGLDYAAELRIRNDEDLFGGVVPHAFVATKTITHALPGPYSAAPDGWAPSMARKVQEVVLPGYSVFNLHDARDAGTRLSQQGAVRVKKASGVGGLGQWVVSTAHELDDLLYSLESEDLLRGGVVLECNLSEVSTLSVGQVKVAGMVATYYGVQRLTSNNRGEEVYGGSTLTVARGGFDALLQLQLDSELHTAISQARTYHAAALSCFPPMFASRCNYDIAQGVDASGQWRSGVLEQSWRVGGASGAEIAALEAFHADPGLSVARASTVELYGPQIELPHDAVIYFQGSDDNVGPITKYVTLEAYAHP